MDQKSSKINQDNGEEMKKGQASSTSTDHPPSEEGGKRLKVLLETADALFQDYDEREAASDNGIRKLQEDIEKYSKNEEKLRDLVLAAMKEQKFDERLLKLKAEQEALGKRIIARKQEIGAQEISRLKFLIKTMTGVVTEDDTEGKKLIDEMKGLLKKQEAELKKLESLKSKLSS